MQNLILGPRWLALAGVAETACSLCALECDQFKLLTAKRVFQSSFKMNVKRSLADTQIKELSLTGKIFFFFLLKN